MPQFAGKKAEGSICWFDLYFTHGAQSRGSICAPEPPSDKQ